MEWQTKVLASTAVATAPAFSKQAAKGLQKIGKQVAQMSLFPEESKARENAPGSFEQLMRGMSAEGDLGVR